MSAQKPRRAEAIRTVLRFVFAQWAEEKRYVLVIAGAIILHQHMTPREYLGCALMFLAVVLAQIPLPAKAARAGK